ncbi:hypothetical protein [Pseudoalteromonas luteoviolacea]|uniref:hypothetical protein n=1 Tax=Pseudoalteromonas luteoviolacea TaxID=43657 RepID=UPI001B37D267|nr:hypothetical protein [Pseudoalteromonas luteoviolacea]MBQ4838486.1 hypothetical protein [Pseudoalteromonas luteoviolacea]
MKYLKGFFLLVIINLAYAGELDENNGPSEYYHQKLHAAEEAYLVRYERVNYTPSVSNGIYHSKDKLEISAVIELVFKGQKAKNEKIQFYRIYDSDASKNLPAKGQRFIVFFDKFNGKSSINPQDPASVWVHSKKIIKFLSEHK